MNRNYFENDTVQQGTPNTSGSEGVRKGESIAFSQFRLFECGRAIFVVVHIGERRPDCNLYRRITAVEWCVGSMADTISVCTQIYTGILPNG